MRLALAPYSSTVSWFPAPSKELMMTLKKPLFTFFKHTAHLLGQQKSCSPAIMYTCGEQSSGCRGVEPWFELWRPSSERIPERFLGSFFGSATWWQSRSPCFKYSWCADHKEWFAPAKSSSLEFSDHLLWTAPEESRAPSSGRNVLMKLAALVANLIYGAGCFAIAANGWCETRLVMSSRTVLVSLVGTACVELFPSQSFWNHLDIALWYFGRTPHSSGVEFSKFEGSCRALKCSACQDNFERFCFAELLLDNQTLKGSASRERSQTVSKLRSLCLLLRLCPVTHSTMKQAIGCFWLAWNMHEIVCLHKSWSEPGLARRTSLHVFQHTLFWSTASMWKSEDRKDAVAEHGCSLQAQTQGVPAYQWILVPKGAPDLKFKPRSTGAVNVPDYVEKHVDA